MVERMNAYDPRAYTVEITTYNGYKPARKVKEFYSDLLSMYILTKSCFVLLFRVVINHNTIFYIKQIGLS